MKKTILILATICLFSINAKAQSSFSFNTRAWSTNYWTTLIYDAVRGTTIYLISDGEDDRITISRFVPDADLVFPVGIEKAGFANNDIKGPYHHAFSNPFGKIGDFGLGADVSWHRALLGVYAGVYFKSQEICFVNDGPNIRSYYVQPRAGLIVGRKYSVEAGVFYDKVIGSSGSYTGVNKDMFEDGLGLDFSLSYEATDQINYLVSFMMPLHNFFNENYAGGDFVGMNRRVGYIMLTQRIRF